MKKAVIASLLVAGATVGFLYASNAQGVTFDLQVDSTNPTVVILTPTASSTVSSTISLSASSTDNISVSSVQFQIDGVNQGSALTSTSTIFSTTWNTASSTDGTHIVKAIATDNSSNVASTTVSLTVDNTAPVRSAGSPSGELASGTISSILSLTTNESSTCRYATSSGITYASSTNIFTTTGGRAQSSTISGLTDSGSYNYYIRCTDSIGNINSTDYTISFTVASSSVSSGGGGGSGGSSGGGGGGSSVGVSSGGGGGGGGGYYIPTPTSGGSNTIPTNTSGMTNTQLRTLLSSLQAQLQVLLAQANSLGGTASTNTSGTSSPAPTSGTCTAASASPSAVAVLTVPFSRTLSYGVKGDDVKELQQFLINDSAGPKAKALANIGTTGIFIGLTQSALMEYQKSVCITANGILGPITRAWINGLAK